jgi:hypothetical protein
MKHLVLINHEFVKCARSWDELSRKVKLEYFKRHPKTKKRLTRSTYLENNGVFDGRSYLLPNNPWGIFIRKDPKLLKKWHDFINKNVNEHETYKDLLSKTNNSEVWAKTLNDFKKTKPITFRNAETLLNKFSDQINGGKTMDYLFEKVPRGIINEKIIMPVLAKIYSDTSIKDIVTFAKDAIIAAVAIAASSNLL